MAAAVAAPPPRTTGAGPSPQDPAADLGFPAPFRDPAPAAPPPPLLPATQDGPLSKLSGEDHTPDLKPCHGSEGAPDREELRTPESSEFFLRGLESSDKKITLAHEAFTDEQRVQLHAQILIRGYLTHGRPPKETTMILAFGQPAEGQKHVWEKVWRAALDRCQDLLSPMAGLKTPPSSSLMGSCTVEQGSKDTTVGNSTVSKPLPNLLQDEKETQGLDVQRHTEVLERNGDEDQTLCGEGSCTSEQDSKDTAVGKTIISEPDSREALSNSLQTSAKLEPAEEHPCCDELNVQTGGISPSVCYSEAITQGLSDDVNDLSENTVCEPQSMLDSCLKCGESGQLQRCCGCTLAAHETCFGSAGRFDDGQFYCPVCFYSKAAEAYKKAEKTLSEAKKNLSGFFGWKRFVEQQGTTGNQQRAAANCKDHACCASERQGCPEKIVTGKTATFGPNPVDARKNHQVGNSSPSNEVPQSSQDRFSPSVANCLRTNSPTIHRRQVRFQEKETLISNSYGNASGRQDQYVQSPARRRYYPYAPDCYSTPARSPLAPRRSVGSTARRARLLWTAEEEAALREGVARFAPKDNGQISWVQILEHGGDLFHPRRLSKDLAQKWYSMKKRDEAAREGAGLVSLDPKACRASLPPLWRKERCNKDDKV